MSAVPERAWIAFISKMIFGGIVFFSTIYSFFVFAPWVETQLYPAVGHLNILEIREDENGASWVNVQFDKKRQCEYIGISWYHVAPNNVIERVLIDTRPVSNNDSSSPNRPLGVQVAGPWKINLSKDEVLHRSYAKLFHRCNPFWLTVSDFWP